MQDKNDPPEQAGGEAEHWFAVMQSGAPTDQETTAFAAWRDADSTHARAYVDLEKAWRQAGEYGDHPDIKKMRAETLSRTPPEKPAPMRRRRVIPVILIVVLLVLLVAVFF